MPDRIIRESICTSDTLNLLSDFEERFWTHLIVICDDFGRFDARPAVLKARLFPLRESLTFKNIADCLAKLASVGLIELYEVDGRPFLHVVTWERYQRVRAKKSKFPGPGDAYHTVVGAEPSLVIEKTAVDSISQTHVVNCRQMTANVPEVEYESECEMRNAKCECVGETRTRAGGSAVSAVFTAYFDKIDGTMTDGIRDTLMLFIGTMGPECCIRAIDAAVEANKKSWNYVRRVLEAKRDQGVRNIADWDKKEAERNARKPDRADTAGGASPDERWHIKSLTL